MASPTVFIISKELLNKYKKLMYSNKTASSNPFRWSQVIFSPENLDTQVITASGVALNMEILRNEFEGFNSLIKVLDKPKKKIKKEAKINKAIFEL